MVSDLEQCQNVMLFGTFSGRVGVRTENLGSEIFGKSIFPKSSLNVPRVFLVVPQPGKHVLGCLDDLAMFFRFCKHNARHTVEMTVEANVEGNHTADVP